MTMSVVILLWNTLWSITFAQDTCPCDYYTPSDATDGYTITGGTELYEYESECYSIEACQQKCEDWVGHSRCESLTWDPEIQKCTLYDSRTYAVGSSSTPGRKVCLRPQECDIVVPDSNTAYCWGDPHCKMFNGVEHHYQAGTIESSLSIHDYTSYYLLKNCNPQDYTTLPFALSGGYNRWNDYANIMRTMTLELYLSPVSAIYIYMSNNADYNRISPMYDISTSHPDPSIPENYQEFEAWTIGNSYSFGVLPHDRTQSKFTVTMGYKEYGWSNPCISSYWVKLIIHTEPEQNCEWLFHYQDGHRVDVRQPTCWKCQVCGLLGDLQTPPGESSIRECNGEELNIEGAQHWYPQEEAFTSDGWSWETVHADHCALMKESSSSSSSSSAHVGLGLGLNLGLGVGVGVGVGVGNGLHVNAAVNLGCGTTQNLIHVQGLVQVAIDNVATCCARIGLNECDAMAQGCEADLCTLLHGQVSVLGITVDVLLGNLQKNILAMCLENGGNEASSSSSGPLALYTFGLPIGLNVDLNVGNLLDIDANVNLNGLLGIGSIDADVTVGNGLKDVIHGLPLVGPLVAANGLLECDGIASVSAQLNIGVSNVVSFEILVDLLDISVSGPIIALGNNLGLSYNTDCAYSFSAYPSGPCSGIKVQVAGVKLIVGVFTHYDDGSGSIILYCDGKQIANYVVASLSIAVGVDLNLCGLFEGNLLRVAVYGHILSAQDVYARQVYLMPDICHGNEYIGDELLNGQMMYRGQCLRSWNGDYALFIDNGKVMMAQKGYQAKEISDTSNVQYIVFDGSQVKVFCNGILMGTLDTEGSTSGHQVMLTDDGKLLIINCDSYDEQFENSYYAKTNYHDRALPEPLFEWNEPLKEDAESATAVTMKELVWFVVLLACLLLTIRLVYSMYQCWWNTNKTRRQYKVVSVDSTDVDINSDVEVQQLK